MSTPTVDRNLAALKATLSTPIFGKKQSVFRALRSSESYLMSALSVNRISVVLKATVDSNLQLTVMSTPTIERILDFGGSESNGRQECHFHCRQDSGSS